MKEGRYQDHYTKDGVRESNREKREQARQMRADGMSLRAIAKGWMFQAVVLPSGQGA
ncbi:hypothetical protein [Chromatium okenii]|nr:hypothetical protein [Chromatium okenii]